MEIDHVYDPGCQLNRTDIESYFQNLSVKPPGYYVEFLLARNGGRIHPTRARIGGEHTLYRLYSVPFPGEYVDDNVIKLANFDADETSLPETYFPLLQIGSTSTSTLYICLGEKCHGELILFSVAHDELFNLKGTLQELLAGLNSEGESDERNFLEPIGEIPSPWSLVRQGSYDEIIATVDSAFDVDELSSSGQSLLMYALSGRRSLLAQLLCQRGAKFNRRDQSGTPAYFYSHAFLDGLRLAKKEDADFSLTDQGGNTLLHILAEATCFRTGGDTRCFKYLVDSGVPINQKNAAGKTARELLLAKVDEFELFHKDNTHVSRENYPAAIKFKLNILSD